MLSRAQLCTGSLGDPVVNITFGQDPNTNPGVTPPGYTYTSSSCPNDGFYTITRSSSGCFSNSWHTVSSDHTGNGNFMLVNASIQPADFFVATLNSLCPNTTYEFSAWIMNVLVTTGRIEPDITFRIETPSGVVLNQFNTGSIPVSPQPQWKQYGFFFTTAAGNPTIVLRMTNNAPGGVGNDLALDDITFRPCAPAIISSAIQGNSDKIDVCDTDQSIYTFSGNISAGFLMPVFQWQVSIDSGGTWKDIPGAGALAYTRLPAMPGNYWYRLTVAEAVNAGFTGCRTSSNVLTMNVHPKPAISAGPDRIVIAGKNTTLLGSATGANMVFTWSPPDHLSSITTLNPTASPDRDINYLLTAVSQYGCANQDQVLIKVVAGIFVPTAFTPNNDGKNDNWQIPFLDPLSTERVSVYNRYGRMVYHVTGTEVHWNGTYQGLPQPAGTYVYLVHFKDGTPVMKGTVTLIR